MGGLRCTDDIGWLKADTRWFRAKTIRGTANSGITNSSCGQHVLMMSALFLSACHGIVVLCETYKWE